MTQKYDIIIIGAGPAGTTCALGLKDAGLRVALIDKGHFPRDKTCGDAIPGDCLKILSGVISNFDPKQITSDKITKVLSSVVHFSDDFSIEILWKEDAYNISRMEFDTYLMNAVKKSDHIDVFEGIRVRSIRQDNKIHVNISDNTVFVSEIVIGCDGAHSMVAKKVTDKSNSTALGIRAYYKDINLPKNQNQFYLLDEIKNGYFWIFPVGRNLYNAGLGYHGERSNKYKGIREKFINLTENHPALKHVFSDAKRISNITGHQIPVWNKRLPVSDQHILLCGDAAHLVDPLQGHGIHHTMISGRIAAKQAIRCFKANNFSKKFMKQYDKNLYGEIGPTLRRNYVLNKFLGSHHQCISNILKRLDKTMCEKIMHRLS